MELLVIIIDAIFLSFILFYSLTQLSLVLTYNKKKKDTGELNTTLHNFPLVTIQLPIYNELYVVERLIESIAQFNYPLDKLEIQVLDDSTDETVMLAAKKVEEIKKKGIDIKHIRREIRTGYKAGALAEGLKTAKGEFIAIFDADFIPDPEFLAKTLPYLMDEKVGVVQTKWEHLNKDYSLLTKLQAFGLDAHFTIEQTGRNQGGHFINFNGTAGIWRKSCIEESGGWQADTLTEDLDLSYRAQIKGWKFKYLENVLSPAELPAAMNALKSQQFRWTKGAAECARKHLPKIIASKTIPLKTKLHAIFHLMNSFIFVCILLTGIFSIPMLIIKNQFPEYGILFKIAVVYLLSLFILTSFYWNSLKHIHTNKFKRFWAFIKVFPLFLSVSMGFSLHNSLAVIEGYFGKKTPFIRTPKFNIYNTDDKWKNNKYHINQLNPLTIIEGFLAIYFALGIALGFYLHDLGLLPFHIMLTFGFGFISFYTFKHNWSK